MRIFLKKLKKHIFRTWREEPIKVNYKLRVLPPFFYDCVFSIIIIFLTQAVLLYLIR